MHKKYQALFLEIVGFSVEDVITASSGSKYDKENNDYFF